LGQVDPGAGVKYAADAGVEDQVVAVLVDQPLNDRTQALVDLLQRLFLALRRAALGIVGEALGLALQVLDLVLDASQLVRPLAGGALAQRLDAAGADAAIDLTRENLRESLRAQGKTDEANRVQRRFLRAWSRADIVLTAARF